MKLALDGIFVYRIALSSKADEALKWMLASKYNRSREAIEDLLGGITDDNIPSASSELDRLRKLAQAVVHLESYHGGFWLKLHEMEKALKELSSRARQILAVQK